MPQLPDDIDVTLLALVSYLQHRIFLLEGKSLPQAERLTRKVVSLAYHMAFGENITERTRASIDRAADGLLAAINVLDDLIEEEVQAEAPGSAANPHGEAKTNSR